MAAAALAIPVAIHGGPTSPTTLSTLSLLSPAADTAQTRITPSIRPSAHLNEKACIEHVDVVEVLDASCTAVNLYDGPRLTKGQDSSASAAQFAFELQSSDAAREDLTPRPPVSTVPSEQRPGESFMKHRTSDVSVYLELADAVNAEPPPLSPKLSPQQPPPLPPKSQCRPKAKTVSIVAPVGYSPDDQYYRDTASDPGHSFVSSFSLSGAQSGPYRSRTLVSHQHHRSMPGPSSHSSRLTWADAAQVPLYGGPISEEGCLASSSRSVTSTPSGRRRLRKLFRPPPPSSSGSLTLPSPPKTKSRIWRALSLRKPGAKAEPKRRSSEVGPSLSIYPVSEDGDTCDPPALRRPRPQTHHSGTTSEGTHYSSSSHSTTSVTPLSLHTTPPTTPEWDSPAMSPMVVPAPSQEPFVTPSMAAVQFQRGQSQGSPKLRKKRPLHPPSSMIPSFSSGSFSSRSRTDSRSTGHSSVGFSDFLPHVRPEPPLSLDLPKEYTSRPQSAYAPLAEKHRSSSHALSQLAWTGLCSSDLAALTSKLSVQTDSPERAALIAAFEFGDGAFNPYAEYLSQIPSDARRSVECSHEKEGAPGSRQRVTSPYRSVAESSRSSSALYMRTDLLPGPTVGSQTSRDRGLERSPTVAMRRWTVADVSDEVLVEELDRLRKESTSKPRTRLGRTGGSSVGHGSNSCEPRDRTTSLVYGGPASADGHQFRGGFHFGPSYESDSEDEDDGETHEGYTVEEAYKMVSPEDEEEWRTARRALLCCRELVRTERNYQARLRQLLEAKSSNPMFSLLLSYVPALLAASEALFVHFVDDPSAWGVSAAFIGCEEELENAFVAWCGIVGHFFSESEEDEKEKEKRGRKMKRWTTDETNSALGHGDGPVATITRTVSTFGVRSRSQSGLNLATGKMKTSGVRRASLFMDSPASSSPSTMTPKEPGVFTAALGAGLAFGLAPITPSESHSKKRTSSMATFSKSGSPGSGFGTLTRTFSSWKRKSMPSSLQNLHEKPPSPSTPQVPSQSKSPVQREEKLTVRDLAIQPTQRVMRYVLQYRDLLEHTPISSPSRGLVERALDSAVRIAKKCDRAQGNSAFLRR